MRSPDAAGERIFADVCGLRMGYADRASRGIRTRCYVVCPGVAV